MKQIIVSGWAAWKGLTSLAFAQRALELYCVVVLAVVQLLHRCGLVTLDEVIVTQSTALALLLARGRA